MKRIMALSERDFVKDENGQIIPMLSNLKDKVKKEEINHDIVGYLEKNKLVLFKNRSGDLASYELSPEIINLLRDK